MADRTTVPPTVASGERNGPHSTLARLRVSRARSAHCSSGNAGFEASEINCSCITALSGLGMWWPAASRMREGEPCGGSGAWRAVGCSARHDHEIGRANSIRASTASRAARTWTYVPPVRSAPTTCSLSPTGVAASVARREKRSVPPDNATRAKAWATGTFHYGVDPSDPFREGYTLPDLWFA